MSGFAFGSGAGRAPRNEARDFALGIGGFRYGDLYEPDRLAALDDRFRAALVAENAVLAARFEAYRSGAILTPPEESALLIEVGRPLGAFVARLFGVEPTVWAGRLYHPLLTDWMSLTYGLYFILPMIIATTLSLRGRRNDLHEMSTAVILQMGIGFLLFLPFLIVDLVVSNILVALGMQTLSATQVSLPFKLVLFVAIDGWGLLAQSLVAGYGGS